MSTALTLQRLKFSSLVETDPAFRRNMGLLSLLTGTAGTATPSTGRASRLAAASLGEGVNSAGSFADTLKSLGLGAGGRPAELSTLNLDPRSNPIMGENWDRTFARALGVDDVPVRRDLAAASLSARPTYDSYANQLLFATQDTPANITKQLGRAAVAMDPEAARTARYGLSVAKNKFLSSMLSPAGAIPGAAVGGLVAGPVGAVAGGIGGIGALRRAIDTRLQAGDSIAADRLINARLAPIATKKFLNNYNTAARASRRGFIARGLLPAAAVGAIPIALAALMPPTARNYLNDAASAGYYQTFLD
jgi:hypothetical protein